MKSSSPIINRKFFSAVYLVAILPLIVTISTYLIVNSGKQSAVLIIAGAIGGSFAILSLLYPIIGFYISIVFAFFLFDIERFTRTGIPLGTVMDGLIFLTFFGVLLRKIAEKESFWKHLAHPIVLMYLITIAYSIIELFNPIGGTIPQVFNIYRRFITLMLFLYCSVQLFTDEKTIWRFMKIYLGLALFAAMYGCYQEWFGYPRYEMAYILSDPVRERLLSLDNGNYRKFSTFSSPTDFGLLMACCTLIALIFLLNRKDHWKRKIIYACAAAFFALAMSYSGTRTATFMLTIGVVLYVLMTITNRNTLIFSCFFALAFVVIIYGPIHGNATINRLRTTFDLSQEESLQVRDVNRKRIQPFIHSHPLGGGLGTSGAGSSKTFPEHPLADFPSDSGLLRMAIEYGWIGLFIQCLTYFIVLQKSIHAYYRSVNSKNKVLFLAATVGLFGYIVGQYAQLAIGHVPGSFLVYALIAIVIRLRQIELANNS